MLLRKAGGQGFPQLGGQFSVNSFDLSPNKKNEDPSLKTNSLNWQMKSPTKIIRQTSSYSTKASVLMQNMQNFKKIGETVEKYFIAWFMVKKLTSVNV